MLFHHIQYSVNHFSDTIHSALNGLVNDDNRAFVLQTLLKNSKLFSPEKGREDLRQCRQLFDQEISIVLESPNSSSLLLHILGPLDHSIIVNLLAYPSFNPVQRLVLALGLLHSPIKKLSQEGVTLMNSIFPSLTPDLLSTVQCHHLMELRSVLSNHPALSTLLPILDNLLHHTCSTDDALLAFADSLFASSSGADLTTLTTNVSASVASSLSLAGVVAEHGPACTASADSFSRLLADFGDVSEHDVGELLAVILCTNIDKANPWNLSVVSEVLSTYTKPSLNQPLNWEEVLFALDTPLLQPPVSLQSLSLFLSDFVFQMCKSTDSFVAALTSGMIWVNVEAQIELLETTLSLPQSEQPSFTVVSSSIIPSPDKLPPPPGRANQHHTTTVPPAEMEPWLSLDLLRTVLLLGDTHVRPRVGQLLQKPIKLVPEVVLLGLSMLDRGLFTSSLYDDIQSTLFPAVLRSIPAASPVLYALWEANYSMLTNAMVMTFHKEPSSISRLIDIAHELRSLMFLLKCKDLSFALGLASLAARREYLNLEIWLTDKMQSEGSTFANAAVKFLTSRTTVDVCTLPDDVTVSPSQEKSSEVKSVPITSEIRTIFLKTFQEFHEFIDPSVGQLLVDYCRTAMQHEPSVDGTTDASLQQVLKQQVLNDTTRGPSKIDLTSPPEPPPTFPSHIDEIANDHFTSIFDGSISLNEVVILFKRLSKAPQESNDYLVFRSMLHHLLDEIRFIDLYPPVPLRIFARVLGVLFACDVVTNSDAGLALRQLMQLLLDLQKHSTTNYPHRQVEIFVGHFVAQFVHRLDDWSKFIEFVLELSAVARYTTFKTKIIGFLRQVKSHGIGFALEQLDGEYYELPDKLNLPFEPHLVADDAVSTTNSSSAQQQKPRQLPGGSMLQGSCDALLKSARRRVVAVPEVSITDHMQFILNNIRLDTAKIKGYKDIRPLLLFRRDVLEFFAEHLVVRRIVTEPKNHELYFKLIEGIVEARGTDQAMDGELVWSIILDTTTHHIKGLLADSSIASNFEPRSALKALGSWLGMITLGRDTPLMRRDLYIRGVLIEGYVKNRLIAVVPFVSHVLKSCLHGKLFRPPCPWTMYILAMLLEIYEIPESKLNIKFEIESLFRTLSIQFDDVVCYNILANHTPEPIEPDPPTPAVHNKTPAPIVTTPSDNNEPPAPTPAIQTPDVSHKKQKPVTQPPNQELLMTSSAKKHVDIDSVVSTGIAKVSELLDGCKLSPKERTMIINAIKNSLRETTSPVVDRAVKIALNTSKVLVNKDFSVVTDLVTYQNTLTNTVSILASHLSSVTCKEPLRYSLHNQLNKELVDAEPQHREVVQSTIQAFYSDIVHTCSTIIESASSEMAIQNIKQACHAEITSRSNGTLVPPTHHPRVQQTLTLPPALKWVDTSAGFALTEDQQKVYSNLLELPKIGTKVVDTRGQDGGDYAFVKFDDSLNQICSLCTKDSDLTSSVAGLTESHPITRNLDCVFAIAKKHCQFPTFVHRAISAAVRRFLETLETHPSIRIDVLAKVLSILKETCSPTIFKAYTEQLCWNERREEFESSRLRIPPLLAYKVVDSLEFFPYIASQMENCENAVDFSIFIIEKLVLEERLEPYSAALPLVLKLETIKTPKVISILNKLSSAFPIHSENQWKRAVEVVFAKWITLLATPPSVEVVLDDLEVSGSAFNNRLGGKIDLFIDSLFARGYLPSSNRPQNNVTAQQMFPDAQFIKNLIDVAIEQALPTANDGVYNPSPLDSCALLLSYCIRRVGASQSSSSVPCTAKLAQRVVAGVTERMLSSFVGGNLVDQRPWLRLFSSLLVELTSPDPVLDSIYWNVITLFFQSLRTIRPSVVPAFALSWVQLLSHKSLMPALLNHREQNGWLMLEKLIILLLQFLEPFLKRVELDSASKVLYKGLLRILLVLLHDFPEFLAEFHFSFCDVIPSTCIQMRNLILSAFPRTIRLPDPFTPNLKVDLLPSIGEIPRISSDYTRLLTECGMIDDLNQYLTTEEPASYPFNLIDKLLLPLDQVSTMATKYNISLINALVLHVGNHGIKTKSQGNSRTLDMGSSSMLIFFRLIQDLDSEGRYYFINAIVNQLRYPNAHTHYFSRVLLYIFGEMTNSVVLEQITRVLLERLIVNRPHPWGLLITFIELVKNKRYHFWDQEFINLTQELKALFSQVYDSIKSSAQL
ncbi:hypothetical protein P9112_000287 [Eukaryota sp. TZLM1-RC]